MDTPEQDSPTLLPSPPWKLPYSFSVEALRLPALAGVLVLHLAALVPSFLQHFLVLSQDKNVELSYSLSIWIGCVLCACFAVPGYWFMTAPLLAVHGVISAIAGSAMTVAQTLVYFSAQLKCTDGQSTDSTEQAWNRGSRSADVQGDVGSEADDAACTTCLAWGRDTCEVILKTSGVSYWGAWAMAPFLTAAAATSIVLSQRISSERQAAAVVQAATDSVKDSRRTIVQAQTALQQAGRLPTADADSLRAALQNLWRSERDEFRVEARQFVAEAVAHGHSAFESALPHENAGPRRSHRATGGKVAPQPNEDETLSLHLMAGAPPKSGQSSPSVVIDVGGGINADADQISDQLRVQNAPSLTLSPTSPSPAPAESPLVGSPDPAVTLGQGIQHDMEGFGEAGPSSPRVTIGSEHEHKAPIAWGSLEEDGSPSKKTEGGKRSSKKKSKDKDKEKKRKGKDTDSVEEGAGDDQEGKGKKKSKKEKAKKGDDDEPESSPKKEKKSTGKKGEESDEGQDKKKGKKAKDSKEKKEKSEGSKDKKEKTGQDSKEKREKSKKEKKSKE